jgi:hypothetical protein
MALSQEDREVLDRLVRSVEGIEVLLAMWLERSLPAGEIWVEEGPGKEMAKKPWRLSS